MSLRAVIDGLRSARHGKKERLLERSSARGFFSDSKLEKYSSLPNKREGHFSVLLEPQKGLLSPPTATKCIIPKIDIRLFGLHDY